MQAYIHSGTVTTMDSDGGGQHELKRGGDIGKACEVAYVKVAGAELLVVALTTGVQIWYASVSLIAQAGARRGCS